MTDPNKKTSVRKGLDARALSELRNGSKAAQVLNEVTGVDTLLKYVAERFNSMRAQLSDCCTLLKRQESDAFRYVIMGKSLAQGDYGLLLDEETDMPPTYAVEDAAEFAKCMKSIYDAKRYETRLSVCIRTGRLIGEAIERLRSKAAKMEALSSLNGATPSELDVAAVKSLQFREAIDILRKRGSLVTKAYYDARKQILDFVAKSNEEFTAINYNEEAHA